MSAQPRRHTAAREFAASCSVQCKKDGTGRCNDGCGLKMLQVNLRRMQSSMACGSLILLRSSGVIDSGVACCGMAGDRGMRFPEVIESSTAPARTKIESRSGGIGACVSSSRTCEAAMSQGTGRGFVSVMHVLDACSKPKASVAAPS
jgi:hypothetical protein